ncbi:MAG TPA: ArsA family ATPase [Acidimicrobiia bacterium]|jgi:arsenite-transporting ATPase|nr:ArsA family ATPase [Acidimicrobiia bacterium]
MRILLFTGKGGVGKTTVAAATAVATAASGLRTLILSTDPAHSLADAFAVPLGDQPTEVCENLWGGELDTRTRFEAAWSDVREYVVDVLDWAGAGALEAEELSVVPGLDEVFALAELRERAASGEFDVIVVDCAPTAETLRLLSLPDVLAWYMDRVFDSQRRLTKLARPMMSKVANLPIARDSVFAAVRRFYDRLDGVRELLTDGSVTTARLVVNPERMVVAEARRTFTYLSLFGYHVDAVIANRLLPAGVADPWFDEWKRVQSEHLTTIEDAFAPLPILTSELAAEELIGVARLGELAARVYGDTDAAAVLCASDPLRIAEVDGSFVLSLHLPFTVKSDIELGRNDDELFLAVGPHRRAVVLPDALARREVVGARLDGDRLEVEFATV